MKAETKKKFLRLKELATQSQACLIERIGCAAVVMADLDWIAETHGGDDFAAAEAVMGEYFPDLAGVYDLQRLIAIYKHFSEAEWRQYRGNLQVLNGLYEEAHAKEQGEPVKRTRISRADLEAARETISQLEAAVARAQSEADVHREEVARLRERVDQLLAENAELRGRLAELRSRVAA